MFRPHFVGVLTDAGPHFSYFINTHTHTHTFNQKLSRITIECLLKLCLIVYSDDVNFKIITVIIPTIFMIAKYANNIIEFSLAQSVSDKLIRSSWSVHVKLEKKMLTSLSFLA